MPMLTISIQPRQLVPYRLFPYRPNNSFLTVDNFSNDKVDNISILFSIQKLYTTIALQ